MLPQLALSLLLALVTDITSAARSNVLTFGVRKINDKLLFEYSLSRIFKPFQILTESVVYPMTTGQRPGVISVIEVAGTSGRGVDDIQIKNGGIGQKFVHIIFKSARGRSLDYKIRIYGDFPAERALPSAHPTESRISSGSPSTHQYTYVEVGDPDPGAGGGLDGGPAEDSLSQRQAPSGSGWRNWLK